MSNSIETQIANLTEAIKTIELEILARQCDEDRAEDPVNMACIESLTQSREIIMKMLSEAKEYAANVENERLYGRGY